MDTKKKNLRQLIESCKLEIQTNDDLRLLFDRRQTILILQFNGQSFIYIDRKFPKKFTYH